MARIGDLEMLYAELDAARPLPQRLGILRGWLASLPDIDQALLCCDGSLHGPYDTCPGVHVSRPALGQIPLEPSVLNGESSVIRENVAAVRAYPSGLSLPLLDQAADVVGAFLLSSRRPGPFLRRNRLLLNLLLSKVRSVVEIEQLRSARIIGGRDTLSALTTATARFVEAIGLPVYVRAPGGSFVALNGRFRRMFRYATIEEINARSDVLIYEDDPEVSQHSAASRLPIRAHLRTGENRVRVIDEYATTIDGERIGVVVDVTEYVDETRRLQRVVATQATLNEQLAGAAAILQKTQATAIKSLAKLAEYRDKETGGHLQRICEYMRLVTQEIHEHQPYSFSIASGYSDDIFLSGMLHDIGKVGVPDQILLKEGPLAPAEWSVMKQHTEWGHSILSQADQELGEQSFLTLASRIARNHHEWWDGSGYPDGLEGEEIPLSARIGAIADVYDALTSRRPYKEPWSHEQAVEEIQSLSERQFDPVIVDILARRSEEFREVRRRFPDELTVLN